MSNAYDEDEVIFKTFGIDVSRSQVRHKFRQQLSRLFARVGIDFVDGEVVRGPDGRVTWRLTVVHPTTGIETLAVKLSPDVEAYSIEALGEMAARLRVWSERVL